MNHQKIQSVLYIGLLLSSLTLMIGCQQPSGGRITTNGDGGHGWHTIQFPDPNDNGGDPIEIVVYDFIGLDMMEIGAIQRMEMRFEDQTLLFNIWDDQAIANNQPIEARLNLDFQQGFNFVTVERQVTYSDNNGSVYLIQGPQISPGIYEFRVEFENFGQNLSGGGNLGLLGYVNLPLCEADRSC